MLTVSYLANSLLAWPAIGWAVGWQEILVIVVIVLILFGGRKIPELAKGLGKGLREFKKEMRGVKQDFAEAIDEADDEPAYTPPRRKKKKRKRPRPAETEQVAEADADQAEGDDDSSDDDAAGAAG